MDANNTIEIVAKKIAVEFEEVLIADGKAAKTLESYVGDIKVFLQWLESKVNIFTGSLKRFYITTYRKYLVQEGYKINTINKKINSLQSLNQFLIDKKYLTEQVVDLKKDKLKVAAGSEQEVEVFSDTEIEKLLFYIQSEEASSRDRLIILLLLYAGVRVSELVNIRLKDIDMISMNLTITWRKGGKRRDIPIKVEVIEAIKEYLDKERSRTNHSCKASRSCINSNNL